MLAILLLAGCASSGGPTPAAMPTEASVAAAPTHVVVPQSSWAEAILYFVVVDRYADGKSANNVEVDIAQKGYFHGGDLVGLRGQLDQLAELGVTALWLTPVVKNIPGFVTGAGFRDFGYHGYWADDFTALDARFGSEEELRQLVEASHARGIKVLLDVVYNHVGYESAYTENPATRSWLRSSDPGGCGNDDLTQCLSGLPDLKTELPKVREYLFEAHLGLAQRTGLDGFRLDTVKHVEHDFWQEHRRRADALLGQDFFLLGEVWGGDGKVLDPYFADDELDAGFDFGFQGSAIAFVEGRGRTVAFGRYLEKRQQDTRPAICSPTTSAATTRRQGSFSSKGMSPNSVSWPFYSSPPGASRPSTTATKWAAWVAIGRRTAATCLGASRTSCPAKAKSATRRCAPTTAG